MRQPKADLTRLSQDELERRAREHLEGMVNELHETSSAVRARVDPLEIAKRHPIATAAVAGIAGLLLARLLTGGRRRSGGAAPVDAPAPSPAAAPPRRESAARVFGASLLSSVAASAGRALPGLILWYVQRKRDQQGS